MALNSVALRTALHDAYAANLPNITAEQQAALGNMCQQIADAMVAFVSGADVVYTTGLVAPPGGGPVTGVSGMTIS